MAQKILLRRGGLGNVNSGATIAVSKGEQIFGSGSLANTNIGDIVFVANADGNGVFVPVGRLFTGTAAANSFDSKLNGLPYYKSDEEALYILGGTSALDLSGNLEGTTVAAMTVTSLSGGTANFSGDITGSNLLLSGNANIDGDITLGGNINIGDADTDTITLGGEITSNIIPDVDSTYDLGSTSKRWANIYVDDSTGDTTTLSSHATIDDIYVGRRGQDGVIAIGSGSLSSYSGGSALLAIGDYALEDTTGIANHAIGNYAGTKTSTGTWNTAVGYVAGYNNNGDQNTYLGAYAGPYYNIGTGNYNVLIGNNVGIDISGSAEGNTGVGQAALYELTNGSNNTVVGRQAGQNLTTGGQNVALGVRALNTATTVDGIVAIGYEALKNNSSGTHNIAIGGEALLNTTTGGYNIGIGYRTLYENLSGYLNIAIGDYALDSVTTGNRNIGIGSSALDDLTTGYDNTAIGELAGHRITTGNRNLAIGPSALGSNQTGTENIALGYLTLGSSIRSYNTAVGLYALQNNTTGENNTALGFRAGRFFGSGHPNFNQTGTNSVYIGAEVRASANGNTNEIIIGYNTVGNGSNTVTLGNSSITDNFFTGNLTGSIDDVFIADWGSVSASLADIEATANAATLQGVTDNGNTTTNAITVAGLTSKNITVGVSSDNTITTSTGNLTLDSAGGTVTISDNVTISGNLTVQGTQTTVDSTEVNIGDAIITLNAADGAVDGGVQVIDTVGTAGTGSILWNATSDYWYAGVSGSTHYRIATYTNATPSTNAVPRIDSNKRLVAGSITDTGTNVTSSNAVLLQSTLEVDGTVQLDAAGGSDAGSNSSAVAFRNSSNQIGYISTTETTDVLDGVLGYKASDGSLVFSTVIDGGTF